MKQPTKIHKAAFLARINQRAARRAVDTYYDRIGKADRLVIVYDNGEREVFKGFKAA